jgi:signal transduction histidine kinase
MIEIGLPLDAFYSMLNTFTWTLLVASPLLLILASGAGYWMSRRALQPVDLIAVRAREIGAQSLSGRLPLRGSGDELDRLSETLNEMLSRLESSFRRITQFTADASHELRTPIAIVQTTAEVTMDRPRSPEEHLRAWKLVLGESGRMGGLVEDLLTLARADSGTDRMLLEAMDLADCVGTACQNVRVLFEAAGLELHVELPAEFPFTGDPEALRRLCLILLDNAIKYSGRGREVRVSLRESRHGERAIAILEVRDEGIGISAADQQHIFDRFYRVSRDRLRKNGGAGLGLSIAQWIASRHGGNIEVDSTPGTGSTFRVSLPAA